MQLYIDHCCVFPLLMRRGLLNTGCSGLVDCGLATPSGPQPGHRLSDGDRNSSDLHFRSSWVVLALGAPPGDNPAGNRGTDPELVSLPGRWRSRHLRDPGFAEPSLVVEFYEFPLQVSYPIP